MHKLLCALALTCALPTMACAHELTPTYPELRPSYVNDVMVASLKMFNYRPDARFYEVQVFTADWKPIKFATQTKILEVNYLEGKPFDVYIRKKDADSVTYICTMSKLEKGNIGTSAIASRVCSKIKR